MSYFFDPRGFIALGFFWFFFGGSLYNSVIHVLIPPSIIAIRFTGESLRYSCRSDEATTATHPGRKWEEAVISALATCSLGKNIRSPST